MSGNDFYICFVKGSIEQHGRFSCELHHIRSHPFWFGVNIDAEPTRVRADVVSLARQASNLLDLRFDEANVEVVAGHAGPAYGVPHEATIEAIRLAGRLEALALDPVYSGKGLAGLIALIRQGRWRKGEDIIFLHTGGEPALFAYQDALGI